MAGYRKLGRPTDQRRALLRGIVTEVIKHGKVNTTLFRAKEARKIVDKMITLGKKGDLHARRQALAYIYEAEVVHKIFDEWAEIYRKKRRIYKSFKLGTRKGDGAETAVLELVE
jgi:large subunit ribosomal protein L17